MRTSTYIFRTMSFLKKNKLFTILSLCPLTVVLALSLVVLSPSVWAAPGPDNQELLNAIIDVEDDIKADITAHDTGIKADIAAHDTELKALVDGGVTWIYECDTEILAPGLYMLANDLICTNERGIDVKADFVTIDLNGHLLSSTSNTLQGVNALGARKAITVRNGTVAGFWQGLWLAGKGHIVENMRVINNGNVGVTTGEGCTIRNNIVADNGGNGISTSTAPTIIGNTLRGNTGTAITPQEGATIANNTATGNGNGFFVRVGSTVIGNTAYSNSGDGMTVICPSNVIGNTVVKNGGDNLKLSSVPYAEPCNAEHNLSSTATLP